MKDVINWIRDRFVNYKRHPDVIDTYNEVCDRGIITARIADNSVTAGSLGDYTTTSEIDPNSIIICGKCNSFAPPNSECVMCGHVNERCN